MRRSMPLRLVLDTNVVLDLFHFADAAALPILAAIESGRAECWVEAAGFEELQRVVTYPQLKIAPAAAAVLLERYRRLARLAAAADLAPPRLPICKDPDDQKFLELAARLNADWLISKDKALLKLARSPGLSFRILTPAAASAEITNKFTSKPSSGHSHPYTPSSRSGQ